MALSFEGTLLMVEDVGRAREFYEGLLGMTVEMDLGAYVTYTSGISIQEGAMARSMIFGKDTGPERPAGMELYFETEEIERESERLSAAGVSVIHPVKQEPWGQRTFRFFDPDGHVIEIGEPMSAVIRRMVESGLKRETIAEVTGMPMELILRILG